ncbi:sigma-E factor negative regulatory protein [Paraburkholderia caballeronis]|uniref:Anti sigma-E protein, RseA n=1 Tax=Paraburkholderia caballeronis TaxID=416943 RepID=A0A1H7MJM7_9BURK|nr:sigma-E factor negative regulatory protein [Paraburkholderia caballeronis]PXW26544.1 RseA-like anti sigma(E) protein [Paraburkholderia caballeronis]PXX02091.1 RseA-like anti sigma(E) protein [Paraburkholderia caballeronis]RAK01248.1 RseA-like anti sigma(E) protein [Paraburkholderia caballeronis]SEB89461.1 anti sigma-E protein, RseA [Paraburkholderia caballeronis]SEL11496.1 anti sigma-E protein, RseA [Paraburkholderia caballeronis]
MGSISMQSVSGSRGERLSAFVDGELSGDGQPNGIFSDLNRDDRAAWSSYHLIGDVLRSDDLALSPAASSAFMAGFAARLDAEPHVLAPAAIAPAVSTTRRLLNLRRRVVPTLAVAAAAATLTWIVVPQMHGVGVGQSGVQVASVQPSHVDAMQRVAMPAVATQDGNIIRDARLDEYFEAHQQFAQQPVMSDSMPLIRAAALTTQGQ